MLWVVRLADLVQGIDQSVLAVGLERNMECDRGAVGGVTNADPVFREVIPLVLYKHVTPM
jgi:hypothetical protein